MKFPQPFPANTKNSGKHKACHYFPIQSHDAYFTTHPRAGIW